MHRARSWSTSYPPLVMVAGVLFLLLVVLPSSLHLPQANPQTVPEYAPVPPEDGEPSAHSGNLASLGLTSSGGLASATREASSAPGSSGTGGGAVGAGKNASTKRCVGKPPRQTEDPMSPPCVALFTGDNFGATYTGVTAEEIRVVFYFDQTRWPSTSKGTETDPREVVLDVDAPEREEDPVMVRDLRALSRYFNDRYQTYGRRAHFYVQYASTTVSEKSPTMRRADAIDAYEKVRPFAEFNYGSGAEDEYTDSMAKRGVLNFGGYNQRSAALFTANAGRVWGYSPSVEQQARNFSDLVCRQVVDKPVSFSGTPTDQGAARRLGLLRAEQPDKPSYSRFAALVKEQVQACGGKFVVERGYPRAGYNNDTAPGTYAQQNMAAFREAGVTTIIWPQGLNSQHSKAAAAIGYQPEWVIAGDLLFEGVWNSQFQDQTVWSHAFVATTVPKVGTLRSGDCFQALRSIDPAYPESDADEACEFYSTYEDIRQMFTGIQVAGPRLGPTTMERGFRAIPPYSSGSPTVPACYYEPGDYTCVKDAALMWWDPSGHVINARNGCWRMVEGGARRRVGEWPDENLDARRKPTDPCNAYDRAAYLY